MLAPSSPSPCPTASLSPPSSPCTPARPNKAPLPTLAAAESAHLSALCTTSARRSPHRSTLVATLKVHNPTYLACRHILITWLLDVATTLHLSAPTLHLAVRHTDFFLSLRPLPQRAWQLAAAAALHIASKTEESLDAIPLLTDLRAVTGDAYPPTAFRDMEIVILETLRWDTLDVTPLHFLAASLGPLDRLHCAQTSEAGRSPSDFTRSAIKRSWSDLLADVAPPSDDPSLPPLKAARLAQPGASTPPRLAQPGASSLPAPTSPGVALLASHSPVTSTWSPVSSSPASTTSTSPRSFFSPAPADALSSHLSVEVRAVAHAACACLDQALYDPVMCAAQSPQHMAAAALRVGRGAAGLSGWPKAYAAATGLMEAEFEGEARKLMAIFHEGADEKEEL